MFNFERKRNNSDGDEKTGKVSEASAHFWSFKAKQHFNILLNDHLLNCFIRVLCDSESQ